MKESTLKSIRMIIANELEEMQNERYKEVEEEEMGSDEVNFGSVENSNLSEVEKGRGNDTAVWVNKGFRGNKIVENCGMSGKMRENGVEDGKMNGKGRYNDIFRSLGNGGMLKPAAVQNRKKLPSLKPTTPHFLSRRKKTEKISK
jgi:hypothetical protein